VFLAGALGLSLAVLRFVPSLQRLARSGGALSDAAVQTVVLLLSVSLLTWLIGVRGLGLAPHDFGHTAIPEGLRRFGGGILLGAALAGAAMLVAVPAGHAGWREDGGSSGSWLATVGLTSAVLLPAALAEELMFRGVPMVLLSRSFGRGPAIVLLSGLFGLGHLLNPGITVLAVANIVLAGVFLGLAFFTPGGLWTSTGAHFGWNLALAGLAAPVSGLPFPMPWLDYAPGSPWWLTGGSFGPEGGLLATLCLAAGAAMVARRAPREAVG
jgi:hypothetical protein